MLLHVINHPGLVAEIRDELKTAGYDGSKPANHADLFPNSLPLLRSVFWETLRLHNVAASVREVVEPTQLAAHRTWNLKRGSMVTMPALLIHKNPALHPDPESFHPKRFLDVQVGGNGANRAKTMKPFGGGPTLCPGRVVAEKQVMSFIAAMCVRYDMKLMTQGWEFPDHSDFEYVAGRPRGFVELKMRAS